MTDIQKPDMSKQWANAGDKTPPADSLINAGWISGDIPTNTDFNFIDARQDQGVAYMLQKGIPEWDSATEYQANKSYIQYGGKVYKCIQTGTNKQPDTQLSYWRDEQGVSPSRIITSFDGTGVADGSLLSFAGRDTVGDGGGGPLRFLSGSTATANGITIYAVSGGRLVREGWSVFGVNALWAGIKGDFVDDCTVALSDFLEFVKNNGGVGIIPAGRYKVSGAGFKIPSSIKLYCHGTIEPVGVNSTAVRLDNTKYSDIFNLRIVVGEAGQKALSIRGDAGYSELNNFYGLLIDSNNLPASSVGVELDNAFSNFFYGARVLRVAKQVTFANASNANIFYGGELRSNNTLTNGSNPITHGVGCHGNAFIGTVIENQRAPIKMDGGELTLMGRCYLEAFYSPEAIQMNGGSLTIDGNYLNNAFVFVNGVGILRYLNNDVDGSSSNANYPFVQYRADVNTQLELRGNKTLRAGAVIYRPREWYDGSAWAYRGIANRAEFVQMAPVRFQSRLAADAVDVTGDGTTYQIVWGGNEQFDDGSNMGAVFAAPENGLYQFELSVYVSGVVAANHDNVTAKIVTSNRNYTVWFSGVDGVQSTGGQMIFRGTCFADMEAGDSAYATVQVSGSSKVVDILRGDAVNGFTTFSGFKVA